MAEPRTADRPAAHGTDAALLIPDGDKWTIADAPGHREAIPGRGA